MDIKAFWKIIESTRKESDYNTKRQKELIIDKLITYSIEDIVVFKEIFNFFTSKLEDNDGLAHLLVENFDMFLSDDGWYYFCLGTVALGKDLYTMALFDSPKFIKLLEKGDYGHPRSIEQELYVIYPKVMERLTGSYKIEDIYDLEKNNKNIRKVKNEIRSELDSWYLEELKKYI
ncbi:MAG: DUF4240 domain-containing protein [Promethearchaeota archaeon]|nr:MAG: DUF4240 domain-containing protein [Candidatus Lokiarchaeota archaeon]